jgi:spore coat polysaccharide biosynthesis protein SpsF
MTTLAVVQARMGSTRFPGKVLAELGGKPMLAFLLDRLRGAPLDVIVVATSDHDRDDPVAEAAMTAGAAVVRGPEADVLARFGLALARHPADDVVRITADCPLTDPAIVRSVLERHREVGADYTSNVHPRTFPKGLDVEVVRGDALRIAVAEASDPAEREHVTPFLYRRPERFKLANVVSGELLGDAWWTVDRPEDLDLLRRVVPQLSSGFGWREVLARAEVTTEAGRDVQVRPAVLEDGEDILAWRNERDAVRYSLSREPVDATAHAEWFARVLQDPGTQLWIGEVDGRPLGSVRVDVRAGIGTVSIAVADDARRRGFGKELLGQVLARNDRSEQVRVFEAHVMSANEASLRLFRAHGFEVSDEEEPGHLLLRRASPPTTA